MAVAINPSQTPSRPSNAGLCELGTFDARLGNPSLDDAHRKGRINIALKAPAAPVECESERILSLEWGEPQYTSRRRRGGEYNSHSRRIETVVHGLREVQATTHLTSNRKRGSKLSTSAASGKVCGGKRSRHNC